MFERQKTQIRKYFGNLFKNPFSIRDVQETLDELRRAQRNAPLDWQARVERMGFSNPEQARRAFRNMMIVSHFFFACGAANTLALVALLLSQAAWLDRLFFMTTACVGFGVWAILSREGAQVRLERLLSWRQWKFILFRQPHLCFSWRLPLSLAQRITSSGRRR